MEDLRSKLTVTVSSCNSCYYGKISKLKALRHSECIFLSFGEEWLELTLPQGGVSLCELTSVAYLLCRQLIAISFCCINCSMRLLCGNASCVFLESLFVVSVFLTSQYTAVVYLVVFVLPDSSSCQ